MNISPEQLHTQLDQDWARRTLSTVRVALPDGGESTLYWRGQDCYALDMPDDRPDGYSLLTDTPGAFNLHVEETGRGTATLLLEHPTGAFVRRAGTAAAVASAADLLRLAVPSTSRSSPPAGAPAARHTARRRAVSV